MKYYAGNPGDPRNEALYRERSGVGVSSPDAVFDIPRSDKNFASRVNAWVHRDQWEDHKQRYQPVERQLMDETAGMDLLNERLSRISITNSRAFENAFLGAEIRKDRYGIGASESQAQHQLRRKMLEQSKSTANNMNSTRQHVYDRNMSVLAGGAGTASQVRAG